MNARTNFSFLFSWPGLHTALVLYARERYFENHKMMSAVDKLHKLYSSTAPPIVWARSTGVEVLNELDALKAGIIGAAGGQTLVEWKRLSVERELRGLSRTD
jgi:hypothetical protein